MPWSSSRWLPSTRCQLVGNTVVAGRELLVGEGGSVSPFVPPLSPCPPEPHPRSSISASASTGTVTVTDALLELGLFLLWGHSKMRDGHSVWGHAEDIESKVPVLSQQWVGTGGQQGVTSAAGGGR